MVVAENEQLLILGSDHTDRDIEAHDIAASKAACRKVLSRTCVPFERVENWDGIVLRSVIAGGVEYQAGTLGLLLSPQELLEALGSSDLELRAGDVLFLGTLPTKGGIRPSPTFTAEIVIPAIHEPLRLTYEVADISSAGRPPMRKHETEFTAVEGFPWQPVPGGCAGQSERVLAADLANGVATRMLRFEPGTDTTALGVVRHDFYEEVYILSGELHDLTLDKVFPVGSYASRPPGMPHGPWRSVPGCITFEVRYPAR